MLLDWWFWIRVWLAGVNSWLTVGLGQEPDNSVPRLTLLFPQSICLFLGLQCRLLSGKNKDDLKKSVYWRSQKNSKMPFLKRRHRLHVAWTNFLPLESNLCFVLYLCKLHLIHRLICKAHLLIKWRVTVNWVSAADKLFCLIVKAIPENKHCYPILQMRKTESLY